MRSCHASAYGQWLHVKTTTVAVSPPSRSSDTTVPSVSAAASGGTTSPMLSGTPVTIASRAARQRRSPGNRCSPDWTARPAPRERATLREGLAAPRPPAHDHGELHRAARERRHGGEGHERDADAL